jgi:hypothetical protein
MRGDSLVQLDERLLDAKRPTEFGTKIQHSTRCKSYVLIKGPKRGDRDVPLAGASLKGAPAKRP